MAVIGDSRRLAAYEIIREPAGRQTAIARIAKIAGGFHNLDNLAILTSNKLSLAVSVPAQDAPGPNGDRTYERQEWHR